MVRLVKGAYWDTEIKRAQERGLAGYPVFTRKVAHRRLLSRLRASGCSRAGAALYPQFATHNAHTRRRHPRTGRRPHAITNSSACTAWARRSTTQVVGRGQAGPAVPRLCAGRQPRGPARLSGAPAARERRQHLVRQPHRRRASADRRARRRSGRARSRSCRPKPHPRIPLPRDLYGAERAATRAGSTSPIRATLAALRDGLAAALRRPWRAAPIVGGSRADRRRRAGARSRRPPPPDRRRSSTPTPSDVEQALAPRGARRSRPGTRTPAASARAILERAADLYEARIAPS